MLEKVGLHIVNDGDRFSLRYNGKEVDAVFKGVVNSFGVYVDGARLDIDGTGVALASKAAAMSPKGEGLYLNEVNLLPEGECINITAADYSLLLQGKLVAGYKRYSPSEVYNIVADVSTAPKVSYTIAAGVITFEGGATANVSDNMVYNDVADNLDENTVDLTETVTNTNCPFVNVRRFRPIIPAGGTIELHYYVDDVLMSSFKHGKIEDTFTVIVKTASGTTAKRTTYAGEFTLETPAFTTAGETWFSVECIDSNGVGSAVQYFDILVRNPVTYNIKNMVEGDLSTYGIVTRDDDQPISIDDAVANKAALSRLFAAVKQGGYNKIVMLNKTYWIDYHAVNGFGIQTYKVATVDTSTRKITSIDECTEQDVVDSGVFCSVGVRSDKSGNPVWPTVGSNFVSASMKAEDYNKWLNLRVVDGKLYYVHNTSTAGDDIVFPDEFTIDLNGATLAATQCTDLNGGELIVLENNFDTHIINGSVRGNYEGYDFPISAIRVGSDCPGEHLGVTRINSSRYCSLERLDVSGSMGYDAGVTADFAKIVDPAFTDGQRVDLSTGSIISASNFVTTQKFSLSNATAMGNMSNRYIALSRSGYCSYYNMGTQRECFVSFYNGDSYIGSIKTKLYYLVSVPANATHAIYTGYGKTYDSNDPNDVDWKSGTKNGLLTLCCPKLSRGIVIKDCHWHDTRTTAISYLFAKNVLLENNSYTDIALQQEYGVTRILGSFEDSWQWLNGVKMLNLTCVRGAGKNYFSVHYAQNLEMSGIKGIEFYNSGGLEGGFVEDCEFTQLKVDINDRSYHPHVVYNGNTMNRLIVSYSAGSLGEPDPTLTMEDTVIRNKCGYADLRLIRSKNGEATIER